jgi:outer membrane protein W
MKIIAFLFALLLAHPLLAEFHAGAGLSWNTIDETFDSNLHTNENKSGRDRYQTSKNRLAPVVQLGYRFSLCNDWAMGILAQWKYLNYKTPNVNSSRGQILPNATFSSINIFGPGVMRDFTSKTRLNNEVKLLGYLGKQVIEGYAYLGLGPVFFTASNSLYVSSVHTPNGVGDHLISTSVKSHKTVWGGAAQAGYQYCLNSNFFINISYTYLQSRKSHFNNSANTDILNGANNPGATTLFLKRAIKFSAQEFTLSMNLVF